LTAVDRARALFALVDEGRHDELCAQFADDAVMELATSRSSASVTTAR